MLFRLEQLPQDHPQFQEMIGYEWIEVLAIYPVALATNGNDVRCVAICKTPDGSITLDWEDVAIEHDVVNISDPIEYRVA